MSLSTTLNTDLDRTTTGIDQAKSFKSILSGKEAFYNSSNYKETTIKEFSSNTLLPVSYRWNTENKIIRIAKKILSIIIFPYILIHSIIPRFGIILNAGVLIGQIYRVSKFKYKRLTIEVDGHKIDAAIMGKPDTLNNGRWVLASNGNCEFYHYKFADQGFHKILEELNANAIVFDYPGVGASRMPLNRRVIAKAYRAVLTFLEDNQKGIGAKVIIGYGFSIGGAVQADALNEHDLKVKEIDYVFVKDRTFSDLTTEVSSLLGSGLLAFLPNVFIKLFGWSMNVAKSSMKLEVPEIILQRANVSNYEELEDSSKIADDGVISSQASLAKALLDNPNCPKNRKMFLGIPESHNKALTNPSFLKMRIDELLSNFSEVR